MHFNFKVYRWIKVLILILLVMGMSGSSFAKLGLPSVKAQQNTAMLSPTTEGFHLWSPMENFLLFESINTQGGGPGLRPYDLHLYNAQTTEEFILAQDGYAGQASFSSDGSTLSFWYDHLPYLVDLHDNTISPKQVETDSRVVKGAFSSNHDRLLYVTALNEIKVRNLTTGRETSLGIMENISTFTFLSPRWSPNDQWVAFAMEAGGVLVDPLGINNSIPLSNVALPQSEFSSAAHFFIWSGDSQTLYDYQGDRIYSFTTDIQPPLDFNKSTVSPDGAFQILYSEGELFLHNIKTDVRRQLTFNNVKVDQLLESQQPLAGAEPVTAASVADGFDYPVGKPNGTGYNTTAGCWWLQRDGACAPGPHPGQDFNGNGGGDSDLNDPVYAVANGVVVYSANYTSSTFGNIILIEHTLPDGSMVWSQYAHLNSRIKNVNDVVYKGDQIGYIGKGTNNVFWAHLHFEIRIAWREAYFWPPSTWSDDTVRQYYVNPSDFINSHRSITGENNCQRTTGSGIRLYDGVNCTGSERYFSSTGFSNTSDFNDMASSINVGDGWSVKVYEHSDRGGSSRCINGDMWDLSKDYYTSGNTGKVINNDISSIEVYNNSSCTGGSAPNVPSNIRISSSTQYSITVAWDDVSSENGYKIYEWNGSSFVYLATVGANVTSYTETRSSCGWDEFYTVSAYNTYGESSQSNWVRGYAQSCPVLPGVPGLSSPGNGQFLNEGEAVNLSWSSTGNDYFGEVWGGPGGTLTFGWQTGTSKNLGPQWAGYTYSWHVKARNSSGESAYSSTWTFTVRPGAPSSLSATASSCSQINLSWNDNSGNEEGYKVYRNGALIATLGSGVTSYQNTGLSGNTSYSYIVKAYRGSIESNASNTASAATTTCISSPSTPTGVSASDGTYTDKVYVSWNASSGATYYQLFRNTTSSIPGSPYANNISTTYYNDTGAAAGTTYYYWVKACNTAGCSSASSFNTGIRSGGTAGPDLVIQSITMSPVNPSVNQPITFTIRVKNQGSENVSSLFYVDFFIDDQPGSCPDDGDEWWDVSSLAAGATQEFIYYINSGFNTSGIHNVYAFADSYCYISESNENNNKLGPVTINVQGGTTGTGADTVGVFRPSNGVIFLKNSNTSGYADFALNYGVGGDYPIVGDWDGDGDDTIGVYRNGRFLLRNSNTVGFAEINFLFGQPGDQPIAGDWDGDGVDTIGVYKRSTGQFLLRNSNTAGPADITFYLGNVGDVGIAGDWNGDGVDTTGVFRPSNGVIFLKNTNTSGYADVALNYGLAGDKPVVGDWDNDGDTTIGVYRGNRFLLRNYNTNGFANIVLDLGVPGDIPIAGDWDGVP